MELRKVDLEPNKEEFQVFGTTDDACANKPEWLDETFAITDPVVKARVGTAEAEAAAAAEASAAASPENATTATATAAGAKEAAEEARRGVPRSARAHGV